MMGNKILCYIGALALIAVGHGAVETALKEIKEEWVKSGEELDKQSSWSGGRRECWRIYVCG